jgi:hypothetical protein
MTHFNSISELDKYRFQCLIDQVTSSEASFLTKWFAPRGKLCPLGEMFTPSFTPGVNTIYIQFRRMKGQAENFTTMG